MSPVQRSLRKLRAEDWLVAVVEHWNPWARVRQDLWGFADLLAVCGNRIMLVQVTTGPNMAARIAKIRASQAAALWLGSPHRHILVQAWRKVGPRGKRKTWQCRSQFVR